MAEKTTPFGEDQISNVDSKESERVESSTDLPVKVNRHGVALVPRPTDDPRDPLVR
jgi:hypothetical protein